MTESATGPCRLPVSTEFLFRIDIATDGGRVFAMKGAPTGDAIDVAVVGGVVSGPALNGVVLNMGADWGVTTRQGSGLQGSGDQGAGGAIAVTDLDCRLLIRTDDDCLIEMRYGGVSYATGTDPAHYERGAVKDPAYYHFRTTPRFRTGAARYEHLNRTVAVAAGYHRASAGPIYDVYAVT